MFAVWCELFYLHCIDAIRETLVTPPNLLFSQHVSQLVVEIVDFHLYKPSKRKRGTSPTKTGHSPDKDAE